MIFVLAEFGFHSNPNCFISMRLVLLKHESTETPTPESGSHSNPHPFISDEPDFTWIRMKCDCSPKTKFHSYPYPSFPVDLFVWNWILLKSSSLHFRWDLVESSIIFVEIKAPKNSQVSRRRRDSKFTRFVSLPVYHSVCYPVRQSSL